MRIAVVGCCHGELNLMYKRILEADKQHSPVELVLVTGDFQAIRNSSDLSSMSVPKKYLRMGDFQEYFEGRRKAPILTIFIGGNHESSNFMREMYFGGWVCPNIYYLGSAGVVNFRGIRIAGLSGIYSPADYHKGYFEKVPVVDIRDKKSIYHYRDLDVARLGILEKPVDIFLSHDWPRGIWDFGDKDAFLRKKPFLRPEIERGHFGSPPLMQLLDKLRPRFWFASHMHCRFDAQYFSTLFMALDKCVEGRNFFELLDMTVSKRKLSPGSLQYDPEWIAVLRRTSQCVSTSINPHGRVGESPTLSCANCVATDVLEIPAPDTEVANDLSVRSLYGSYLERFGLKSFFNHDFS